MFNSIFCIPSIIGGVLTLAEILAEVSAVEEDADEVNDSEAIEIEEVEEPIISRQDAQAALNLVRSYVEKNFADPAILSYSNKLDEAFYEERKMKEQQSKRTDFFPVI